MLTLEAHRIATEAPPTGCNCHADRTGNPEPPQFAAEAINRSRAIQVPSFGNPASPPEVDPMTWLALVHAATESMKEATKKLQIERRRVRHSRRPLSDKLKRTCGMCAATIDGKGFSLREASMVYDLEGTMRVLTLDHRHAKAVAQTKADREGRDMVLLTVPVYVGTKQEATREELVRPRR